MWRSLPSRGEILARSTCRPNSLACASALYLCRQKCQQSTTGIVGCLLSAVEGVMRFELLMLGTKPHYRVAFGSGQRLVIRHTGRPFVYQWTSGCEEWEVDTERHQLRVNELQIMSLKHGRLIFANRIPVCDCIEEQFGARSVFRFPSGSASGSAVAFVRWRGQRGVAASCTVRNSASSLLVPAFVAVLMWNCDAARF